MVKVLCKQKNPENLNEWIEREIYLDGYLKSNLDVGIRQLSKDFDQVWFIDGREGGGKTNLAVTCAYYVSKPEHRHTLIERIVPGIDKVQDVILAAKPFEAVVIDEAYGGMSAVGFANKINRVLQKMFTEIRAKNLFVFIVAPSFMDISRYFAIWRSQCLLHVYTKGDERGYAAFFNSNTKKKLYILGKKQFYNYGVAKSNFIFRFTNEMPNVIDKRIYDENKRKSNLERDDPDEERRLKLYQYKMECVVRAQKMFPTATRDQLSMVFAVSTHSIGNYAKKMRENEGISGT